MTPTIQHVTGTTYLAFYEFERPFAQYLTVHCNGGNLVFMEVKHPFLLLAAVMLPAVVQAESEAQGTARPAREYQGRVQMHSAPAQIRVPEESLPDKATLTDRFQKEIRSGDSMSIQTLAPQIPPPPVRREREKDRRGRTWIHLGTDADDDKLEKREDRGWGWLANEVLGRQESERAKADEEESAEMNMFLLPTERLLQSVIGQGGLVVQPAAEPATTDGALWDASLPHVMNMLVFDEDAEREKDRHARPQAARETGIDGPDQTPWLPGSAVFQASRGVFSGRDRHSGPASFLPQTAALLARPEGFENNRFPGAGQLPGETPGVSPRTASPPSLFSTGQAGGPVSISSSWETPFAPARSMFEVSSGVAFDSSSTFFTRDPFGSSTPASPIQAPAASPATRPTVDYYGPSWRR